MNLKYKKTVDNLTSQGKFHICLELERISKILEFLGNPQDKIKIIHTAGTNGKGSTCSILANILYNAGFKTGLYTSPHLVEYTERIKINNTNISKDEFAEYVYYISDCADKNNIHLTEFEILTASAYKYFFDKKVDIAVIETGLGGRFDATNVIKSNLLSIITSISIDHKDRLGDTIEKIAYEKAGIIKESSNVVISEDNFGYKTVYDFAKLNNAKIYKSRNNVELVYENEINYVIRSGVKYEFPLLGLHQIPNLELVFEAVDFLRQKGYEISESAIKNGLKTVFWPARLQYIKEKSIIIDGAHNIDAAKYLIKNLDFYFPDKKRLWIYGSLNTKEYDKITKTLFRPEDKIYLYEFDNENAIGVSNLNYSGNIIEKFEISKAENMLNNKSRNLVKIITGSFYMIGELINYLSE